MMKKVAFLGVVLILLAALAVPAMAKSPNHGNGNGGKGGQPSSTEASSADQNQGIQVNQHNDHGQGNQGNHGAKGNGNQGHTHPNTPFYLQGTIKTVDVGNKTIIVTLTHGNAMVKQFIEKDLPIKATDATQIFKITQGIDDESGEGESVTPALSSSESGASEEGDPNRVAIPFDKLVVGQRVAIHGNLVEGVYTARLITMYIQMPVGELVGIQP
jgi:hypothetical protein